MISASEKTALKVASLMKLKSFEKYLVKQLLSVEAGRNHVLYLFDIASVYLKTAPETASQMKQFIW
jgi:hypothetical protein